MGSKMLYSFDTLCLYDAPKYIKPKCGGRRISESSFPWYGNEMDEGIHANPEWSE